MPAEEMNVGDCPPIGRAVNRRSSSRRHGDLLSQKTDTVQVCVLESLCDIDHTMHISICAYFETVLQCLTEHSKCVNVARMSELMTL